MCRRLHRRGINVSERAADTQETKLRWVAEVFDRLLPVHFTCVAADSAHAAEVGFHLFLLGVTPGDSGNDSSYARAPYWNLFLLAQHDINHSSFSLVR